MRLLVALLIAGTAWPLTAQPIGSPAQPDTTLPAVSVVATRTALPVVKAPARITVLDAEDVAASGSVTVADLVEQRSVMFVKRYGPDGLASFALRGTGASHTLVLLDGHRIADPQLGQLDATLLPAALLESVEVLHGPASALYGTDAVGGVVSIQTPRPDRLTARVTTQAGAYGERGVSALATGPLGASRIQGTFAVDLFASQNDYPYVDSTAFNPDTGESGIERQRANTDLTRRALYGRLAGDVVGHRLGLGVLLTDADRGLFDYSAAAEARQEDRALRLWADHDMPLLGGRLHTGGLWQRASLRFIHPQLGLDDVGETDALSLQSRFERGWVLGRGTWTASAGARVGQAWAKHPNLAGDARETATSLFSSLVFEYGRVVITPALRWDRFALASADSLALADTTVQAVTPHLGLNVQPTPWPGLRLKASAGRAFRSPTFNDRFWQPGGDPTLQPERGWTAEAGLMIQARPGPLAFTAEATAFTSRLRDQIVWRPGRFDDGFYWAPVNVGQTRTAGWELSADARIGTNKVFAELGGLWARSAARDRTDPEATSYDQPLLFVPDDQAKAHAALGIRGLRLDLQLRYASERPTTSDGSAALAPYTLFDAGLSFVLTMPTWRGRVAARVENLTDAVYSVTPRSPMPPRTLHLTLTLASR